MASRRQEIPPNALARFDLPGLLPEVVAHGLQRVEFDPIAPHLEMRRELGIELFQARFESRAAGSVVQQSCHDVELLERGKVEPVDGVACLTGVVDKRWRVR